MSFAILEFKTEYLNRKNAKGEFETVAVDYVLLAPRGDGFERTQTWHRVTDLIPRDGDTGEMADIMRGRWALIEPKYKAFKEGEEAVEDGTPLGAWPAVTQDKAKYLRGMGIHTIEHVAEMSSADVQKLPFPNRLELPKLAKMFLDGKDRAAMAQEKAELQERIAAMEEMLAEVTNPSGDGKPKRGRPPKQKVEAA